MNTPTKEEIKTANFEVLEKWVVECPYCLEDQDAPFNEANPMEPMKIQCEECLKDFVCTYERN